MESPTLDVKSQRNSPKGYPYCDWLLVYVEQRYIEYLIHTIPPPRSQPKPSELAPLPPPSWERSARVSEAS